MARPDVRQPHDWLRTTRPLIRQATPRADLLPHVTNPEKRDLFWGMVLSMVVGSLLGLAIVLGLAS